MQGYANPGRGCKKNLWTAISSEPEPSTARQVIQYSYFVKNIYPDMKDYDIAKLITKQIVKIWQAVNPRLPLHYDYYIVKSADKLCFKKAKEINRKLLSSKQQQNLEEK